MNEKIKKVIKVVICFLVLISLLLLMSTYDIKEFSMKGYICLTKIYFLL